MQDRTTSAFVSALACAWLHDLCEGCRTHFGLQCNLYLLLGVMLFLQCLTRAFCYPAASMGPAPAPAHAMEAPGAWAPLVALQPSALVIGAPAPEQPEALAPVASSAAAAPPQWWVRLRARTAPDGLCSSWSLGGSALLGCMKGRA